MSRKEGYYYGKLIEYAHDEKFKVTEHGPNLVGENFIVLKNEGTGYVESFVMTSYNETQGAYYTLIYED